MKMMNYNFEPKNVELPKNVREAADLYLIGSISLSQLAEIIENLNDCTPYEQDKIMIVALQWVESEYGKYLENTKDF